MKKLRAGQPIVVDDLQLIPVESTQLYADQTSGRLIAVAAKKPVAVVVRVAGRVVALDLEGRETSLSALLRDVEGLKDTMREANLVPGSVRLEGHAR